MMSITLSFPRTRKHNIEVGSNVELGSIVGLAALLRLGTQLLLVCSPCHSFSLV
jgi:hypothetical protein